MNVMYVISVLDLKYSCLLFETFLQALFFFFYCMHKALNALNLHENVLCITLKAPLGLEIF